MKIIKKIFMVCIIIILSSSNSFASTLNLGEDVYRFKLINFSSNEGDFINLNIGYGVDDYAAYGVNLIVPYGSEERGIIEVEYQLIPEGMQDDDKEFNYALKIGGVSGNIFDSSDAGVKGGFIIENRAEDKDLYFNSDIIYGSDIVVSAEFGVSGELSDEILGVIGYKLVASSDENHGSARGFFYGIKVDF